jgi:preprotein translocase subunit Sec61beta
MALPLLLNLRVNPNEQSTKHKKFISLNHFGQFLNGIEFQIDYDAKQEIKWGVTPVRLITNTWGFFTPAFAQDKERVTALASALVGLINFFHSTDDKARHLTPDEIEKHLHDIVVGVGVTENGDPIISPVGVSQYELTKMLQGLSESFHYAPEPVVNSGEDANPQKMIYLPDFFKKEA